MSTSACSATSAAVRRARRKINAAPRTEHLRAGASAGSRGADMWRAGVGARPAIQEVGLKIDAIAAAVRGSARTDTQSGRTGSARAVRRAVRVGGGVERNVGDVCDVSGIDRVAHRDVRDDDVRGCVSSIECVRDIDRDRCVTGMIARVRLGVSVDRPTAVEGEVANATRREREADRCKGDVFATAQNEAPSETNPPRSSGANEARTRSAWLLPRATKNHTAPATVTAAPAINVAVAAVSNVTARA